MLKGSNNIYKYLRLSVLLYLYILCSDQRSFFLYKVTQKYIDDPILIYTQRGFLHFFFVVP